MIPKSNSDVIVSAEDYKKLTWNLTTPCICQANVTFYLVDTKLQVGMTLKGTNPNSSDFRQGDKTLITKQLMP